MLVRPYIRGTAGVAAQERGPDEQDEVWPEAASMPGPSGGDPSDGGASDGGSSDAGSAGGGSSSGDESVVGLADADTAVQPAVPAERRGSALGAMGGAAAVVSRTGMAIMPWTVP